MSEMISMADINGKIKEQVKVSFFNLLPDDKFQELVDAEVKAFFEATMEQFTVADVKVPHHWSSKSFTVNMKTPISPFRAIVWAQCREQVDEKLQKIYGENGFSVMTYYDRAGVPQQQLSLGLEEMLRKQANDLAATFFQTMFAQAFNMVAPQLVQSMSDRVKGGF